MTRALLLAAMYVLGGWAGGVLAPPLGYAAPIWPAAGVAVAALLAWGPRYWPGVWLGAFLVKLSLDPSSAGAGVAALGATGATLQAILGAGLTQGFLRQPLPLVRDGDLVRFLFRAGPLACLVSATAGTAGLFAFGRLSRPELSAEWLLWWAGDTLGVLLFAPLALLAWPGAGVLRARGDGAHRIALPLLVTASLLTAGHAGLVRLEESRAGAVAERVMEEVLRQGVRTVSETITPLEDVGRFLAASEGVTGGEFGRFTRFITEHPAIVAVEWAPRVPSAMRSLFETTAMAQGLGEYRIFAGAGNRAAPDAEPLEYFPVLYSEPRATRAEVLGRDHGADPHCAAAMVRARYSGTIALSEAMPARDSGRRAIRVFFAVRGPYADLPPASFTAADGLRGYVVGVFDVERLLAPLADLARESGLHLRVADVTRNTAPTLVADRFPAGANTAWRKDVELGGRTWRLELAPADSGLRGSVGAEQRFYLGFAVLAAFVVALATLGSAGRNAATAAEVAERTAELERELRARREAETALGASEARYRQLIEASPMAMFVQLDGRFAYVNPQAAAMFGARSGEELEGREIEDFVHPDCSAELRERLRRAAARDPSSNPANLRFLRVDGSGFDGEGASVPHVYDGRPGSLVLVQDVTARNEAQVQLNRFFSFALDLLCIADFDGHFRRVNPAFTRVLGWSEEELLGAPFIELVHPDDRITTLRAMDRLRAGGTVDRHDNRYRCKDGSWRRLEWHARGAAGGLVFASARDTTAQHETALQLRQLNADLKLRVDERTAALDALHAKEQELRAVLDNLVDCVITLDQRGIVHSANPAVRTIFGFEAEELIGRNVSMLMAEPHRSQHDGYLARRSERPDTRVIGFHREVEGRHKDGRRIPLELAVSEYEVDGERFYAGTLHDIRERKALIAELVEAREAAEQASRAKSAFLAAMSHEIRTPMNGVLGLADVLANSRLPEEQADLVRTIRDSSSALLRIIDDILDFSKIEAGRLEIERRPVCVAELVEDLCGSLLEVAMRRQVDLAVFIAPDVPPRIMSDELRLRQILYNLVGNAIKFSGGRPGCSGRVAVRVSVASADSPRVVFSVADNGIGIAADRLNELFDPFTQAEASTTRRFGGTGLGLAITKRLVSLMHGEIAVKSAVGVGSAFVVTLPLEAAAGAQGDDPCELAGVECIVVPGAAFEAEDCRAYLERAGARVLVTEDEHAARTWMAGSLGRVVVLAPGADRMAAASPPLAGIAAHRVHIARGIRRRIRMAAGVVTVDGSALPRRTLVEAVAVAAGLRAPVSAGERGEGLDAGRAPLAVPALGEVERRILVVEDDEVSRKVLLQQLALLGYAAQIAENGEEALRMWREGNHRLVLTDLHMPRMDGYALAEAIRREEAGRASVAILALSANAPAGEDRRAAETGIDDYLSKPIRLDALRTALEKWLPCADGAAGGVGRSWPEGLHELPVGPVEVDRLHEFVGDDAQVVAEILADFRAASAHAAAELAAACARGDLGAAGAIAHRFKSSSRSIGAIALGDACAELEGACRAGDGAAVARGEADVRARLAAVTTWIAVRLGEIG